MAVVKNLLVRAGADFSELQKEMQKAEKFMKSAGKQITDIGKTLTLGITAPILGIGAATVNAASDLKEVQNVIDTAFGDSAKKVDEWAKTAIESYGLSELQAKQFAGTMRAMLGSMGLTASEADDMSLSLSSLAGDMASFYNLDPSEAFEKLRSGISGETEPLKQLGINLSVTNLEAYALSKGINKTYDSMTAAEQATLRYNYIMDTTKMAQGDFAKTNDGFANSMRVVKEQLVSIGASLGSVLLPYLEKFLGKVRDLLTAFQNLSPETKEMIVKFALIAAAIGPLLLVIGKLVTTGSKIAGWGKGVAAAMKGVMAGTKGIGAVMTAVFGPGGVIIAVIAGIAALVAGFIYLWNTNEDFKNFFINTWNAIVEFMTPILEYLKTVIVQCWVDITTMLQPYIDGIKTFIVEAWNFILTTIVPILNNIWSAIVTAWQYIWETLQPILSQLKETISTAWDFILSIIKIVLDKISNTVKVGFEVVKSIFTTVTNIIKTIWNNFGDIIVSKIKNVWDTVAGVFRGASQVLQGIFQTLTGLLTGNWSKCWEGIKNIVSGVWNSITSFVKGGVNSIISAINVFIRGINKIKIPDWVPGVGGKGFSISEIPMLAKGTDYFQGGLAIVGEQGPELVSMPRGAQVTPNGKTMDILNNSSNRNMELKLFVDGREFARALAPYSGEESASFNLRTSLGGAY